jgi:hypothetical protein
VQAPHPGDIGFEHHWPKNEIAETGKIDGQFRGQEAPHYLPNESRAPAPIATIFAARRFTLFAHALVALS